MADRSGLITSIAAVSTPAGIRSRLLALALVAGLVGAGAGCGSGQDGTIPPDDANELLSYLNAVEENVQNQDCALAAEQARNFADGVAGLPAQVEGEVRTGLVQAADQIEELASQPSECAAGATGASGPATTTSTTTSEPAETTTETTTEPETTTSEPEPADNGGAEEPNLTPPAGNDGPGQSEEAPGQSGSGGIGPERAPREAGR